jgi:hypothetical protein
MTSNPTRPAPRTASPRPSGRWQRLGALVRWVVLATLAAFVVSVVAADALPFAAARTVAASARTEHSVRGKCRVVGQRVALGLHHHHTLRDGSARGVHERENESASLADDLDLDDASQATHEPTPTPRTLAAAHDGSARRRRGVAVADPSRFSVATGLPRGPPA